jgi:hypothetical protein
MSPAIEASSSYLHIEAEWDSMCDIVPEEPLPKFAKGEVKKVLEEWTSDEEDAAEDSSDRDLSIMEIDQQIGSNFLSDELFGFTTSPVSPHYCTRMIDHDGPHAVSPDYSKFNPLPPFMDSKYHEAFKKLAECMKQSEETRKSLTMKTEKADEKYERRANVKEILNKIEDSSRQLQACFGDLHSSMEV